MAATNWNLIIEKAPSDYKKVLSCENLCPPKSEVFRCFNFFNVEDTRIVILGQDPYYIKGQATGLAFECKGELQPSLKNILKVYGKPNINFEEWAKKGVLLLNTALTTKEGEAKSHSKEWRNFTKFIIQSILSVHGVKESSNMIRTDDELKKLGGPLFICWGNDAIDLCASCERKICSSHPSPLGFSKKLSSGYPSFETSNVFNRIKEITGVEL